MHKHSLDHRMRCRAGSLSCLVSIPLYYVLERKLVKG